ncbi:MAG: HIT family protein [Gammaproteobacteria bacterium]|nr:HIT family protein [Gammaproteobacteria bacterium]
MVFQLDSRLEADSHLVAETEDYQLRLIDQSLVPWLIIVPNTDQTEWTALEGELEQAVNALVKRCATLLEQAFAVDKLNVAAIGNVVSQLHIHVVGRYRNDPFWPGVIWGQPMTRYDKDALAERISEIQRGLGL